MTPEEARRRAETESTARLERFRPLVRNAIIAATVILVLVLLTGLLVSLIRSNQQDASRRPAQLPVAVTPPPARVQCSGIAMPLVVGATPQEFNPGAICFVYLRVDTGRIRFSGPNGSKVVGPEGGDFHGFPVSTAQAVSGSASMRYILCPGRKRSSGDWTCA